MLMSHSCSLIGRFSGYLGSITGILMKWSRTGLSILLAYGANLLQLESLQSFPSTVRCTSERYSQKFSAPFDVRYCVLKVTNSTLQCWCGLVSNILKKSRLYWKLNISNTADNAGMTQSQARDTRYRRMQEINRLCVSKYVNSRVNCRLRRWETLSLSLYCSVSPDTPQPVYFHYEVTTLWRYRNVCIIIIIIIINSLLCIVTVCYFIHTFR